MPVREMDAAILMVPPPAAPVVAFAENPAFESKHPRGAGGRFTTKSSGQSEPYRRQPYEGEKEVSPEVQAFADRVTDILRRLGYNVPRVKVTTVPPETLRALSGANQSQRAESDIPAAFAQPGRMVLLPEYAEDMARVEKTIAMWNSPRMSGFRPDQRDMTAMRLAVHEILHQIGAVREWNAIPQIGDGGARFFDGIQTEEGVVEAVTLDVCNLWGRKWGATFPFFPPGVISVEDPQRTVSTYKDRVVEVRKLSSSATGQHWQSRAATRWRRALLNADFAKRKEMIARVRANPRPMARPVAKKNLSEDDDGLAMVSTAIVTDFGPVMALGQISIPATPRKITRGMLRSMLANADGPMLAYLRAEMADSGSTLRLEMVEKEIARRKTVEAFFGPDREDVILELAALPRGPFQEHLHPRGQGGKFTRKFKVDLPKDQGGGQQEVEVEYRPAEDDDRRALKIPPAWTDVFVTDHPTAPLRALGKDSKGRTQRRYSAEFLEANQAAKFERLRQFDQARETVLKATEEDSSDAAMIVRLIALTGVRPGSEKDTGGTKKAYGATTIQAEHAKVSGNRVVLDFVGKEGIDNHFEVEDPILAKWFKKRLVTAKEGEQIFADANDTTARKWMARNGGEGFLLKDFRTWVATATALRMVKESSPPPPVDDKDFQRRRKEIATHVSGLLNNTPQMALSNYISPAVFDQWRV